MLFAYFFDVRFCKRHESGEITRLFGVLFIEKNHGTWKLRESRSVLGLATKHLLIVFGLPEKPERFHRRGFRAVSATTSVLNASERGILNCNTHDDASITGRRNVSWNWSVACVLDAVK